MKIKITETVGTYAEENSVGTVHILGPFDTMACGLALEDYDYKNTKESVTCDICKSFMDWSKKVSKLKS